MFVKRFNMRVNTTTSASTINIPISLEAYPVDQAELIEREFVDKEMIKAVNPIIDYARARIVPVFSSANDIIPRIKYKLFFNDNDGIGDNDSNGDSYDDIGFVRDDLAFRRNNFKKSFVQLDFYDSPNLVGQNLLFSLTMFCRVVESEMILDGILKPLKDIPVEFNLDNPITRPEGISESYYLYDYKDEVPRDLYMRASFNNAKTGISHQFMTASEEQTIETLVNNLHTKYVLRRDNDGFYYQFDESVSNVTAFPPSGVKTAMIINLYETNVS